MTQAQNRPAPLPMRPSVTSRASSSITRSASIPSSVRGRANRERSSASDAVAENGRESSSAIRFRVRHRPVERGTIELNISHWRAEITLEDSRFPCATPATAAA